MPLQRMMSRKGRLCLMREMMILVVTVTVTLLKSMKIICYTVAKPCCFQRIKILISRKLECSIVCSVQSGATEGRVS